MQRSLIFGLIFSILLVIFALQNASAVLVKIYFWEKSLPLSLLLILTLTIGATTGIVMSLNMVKKKNQEIDKLKKANTKNADDENIVEFED